MRRRLLLEAGLVILMGLLVGSIARASDAVDLTTLARVLDATKCSAASPVAVARLPASCFIAFNDVPEMLGDTYFTPDHETIRFTVPPEIGGAWWDLNIDYMIDRGTLDDVSPAGIVRGSAVFGMDIPVAERTVHTKDDRVPLPFTALPGDTIVLRIETAQAHFDIFELRTASSIATLDDSTARDYFGPMAVLNGMLLSMALFNLLLFALFARHARDDRVPDDPERRRLDARVADPLRA